MVSSVFVREVLDEREDAKHRAVDDLLIQLNFLDQVLAVRRPCAREDLIGLYFCLFMIYLLAASCDQ